jgi:hypothetical protein
MTENVPELENRELIKVSKLHFLVHPGYISNVITDWVGTSPESFKKDRDGRKFTFKQSIALLDKYIEQAKDMPDTEVMVIVTDTKKKFYKEDIEEERVYMEKIREIKEILGKRAVVISDKFELATTYYYPKSRGALEHIKQLLEARGYTFDESTDTEAYGELLGACVDTVANRLNEQGQFEEPTIIKKELTDVRHPRFVFKDKKKYPRIKYK